MQNSALFLQKTMNNLKRKFKNSLTIASDYLAIKTKERKGTRWEPKTMLKNIKEGLNNSKVTCVHGLKHSITKVRIREFTVNIVSIKS